MLSASASEAPGFSSIVAPVGPTTGAPPSQEPPPPPPGPLLVAAPPVPVADGVPEPLAAAAPEPVSPAGSESEHAARKVKPRATEQRARAFMVPGYRASGSIARRAMGPLWPQPSM